MKDKLSESERRFERLTTELSDPEVLADAARLRKLAKERSSLEAVVLAYRELLAMDKQVGDNEALLAEKDEDIRALAKEELPGLRQKRDEIQARIKILLLPRDPADERGPYPRCRRRAANPPHHAHHSHWRRI